MNEEGIETGPGGAGDLRNGRRIGFVGLDGADSQAPRLISDIAELDRACGGGLVPGSAVLVGGDPGIGKSTLLLQAAGRLARSHECAYISGEEAIAQVRLRARRLGLSRAPVNLACATNLRDILSTLDEDLENFGVLE